MEPMKGFSVLKFGYFKNWVAAFLIKLLYVRKNLFPISQKKLEQSINLNHVYDRPFIRYNLHQINHGTIIQTTITCKKIIYKSLLNLACL